MKMQHFVVHFAARKRGCIGIYTAQRHQLIARDMDDAIRRLRGAYEINHVIKVVNSGKAHDIGACCGVDYHCGSHGWGSLGYWEPADIQRGNA